MEWLSEHYLSLVAAGWTIDQLLKIIAPLTKNKVDDNLSDMLGKILGRFFPKK